MMWLAVDMCSVFWHCKTIEKLLFREVMTNKINGPLSYVYTTVLDPQ